MKRVFTILTIVFAAATSFGQLSVTPGDTTICFGESVSYTASGMTLMGWVDTLHQDTTTNASYTFVADSVGVFGLMAVGLNFAPADTDSTVVVITVLPAPDVSITSSAGSAVCDGSSTELIAMSGTATSYVWSPSASLDTNMGDTVIATPSTTTKYYVTVINSQGCAATDSIEISVGSSPTVNITSSASGTDNDFICSGSSATLTATATGVASYEWSPTASLNDSTAMTVTASPTENTTYTVIVTDTNGCTGSDSYELKVNATLPTLTINLEDSAICQGDSTIIGVQSNATSAVWTPLTTLTPIPTTFGVVARPTVTTTYTVTVKRNACEKSGSVTVAVIPEPVMSLSQSSGGSSICLDESDVITATCPDCIEYFWKFPNATMTTTSASQPVSPNEPGAVSILVRGFDDGGCWNTETIIVNVDSCFVGTPFGIDEPLSNEVTVLNQGSHVEFVGNSTIDGFELYNLLGERVTEVAPAGKTTVRIATGELSSGMYIARISMNGASLTKKIYLN